MKVLLACEESQAVCKEFRLLGHEAYSCDLQDESGGHPEWHIKGDALEVARSQNWDLVISFPPCTHLAVSGARWFERKRLSGEQEIGIKFFLEMWRLSNCTENPIGIMNSQDYLKKWFPDIFNYAISIGYPFKPTQVIQPYYFGDSAQKTTCLWLKGLKPLYHNSAPNLFDLEVSHVSKGEFYQWVDKKTKKIKRQPKWYAEAFMFSKEPGKERSKTFAGIAKAMAKQWAPIIK